MADAMSPTSPPSKLKPAKKKILLMGKSGSGKSSMRSIIFSNYVAKDVRRLGATIDVEHAQFKFLGNLILNLWDCGGQDAFTETYLTSQKASVFSEVGVLIYVFDTESRHFIASGGGGASGRAGRGDLETYEDILRALGQHSPSAHVFCLIHKMDLVPSDRRDEYLDAKITLIERFSLSFKDVVRCYGTSIWDQTLYAAWGDIVQTLTPNLDLMEKYLAKLQTATKAEEVILFERSTFLKVIALTKNPAADPEVHGPVNPYPDRIPQLSNIIKSFKHSLQTYTSQSSGLSHPFGSFEISCPRFVLLIGRLTTNTYVLVVAPPGDGKIANVRLNVMCVRDGLMEAVESVGPGEKKEDG